MIIRVQVLQLENGKCVCWGGGGRGGGGGEVNFGYVQLLAVSCNETKL